MPTASCPLLDIAANVRAKRQRRKEARPSELLAAALELFVEKGFAATRAEEVAKRAGVSKGTLFLYFASKEELFKAVVRENISGRFGEWRARIENFEGSSADLLRMCILGWWEHIGSTKISGISKLMMSEAGNFPELAAFYEQEVISPGRALIEIVVARGIERGEFRPVNLGMASLCVMAPLLHFAVWKHSFGTLHNTQTQFSPTDYMAAQVDTILYGFSNRPPTAPTNQPK